MIRTLPARLERAAMFSLCMMPLIAVITRLITANDLTGPVWLAAQTACITLIVMLPLYIGNYSQTDVIIHEGGNIHGGDPNPDRESRHELVRQGHRFAIRLPVFLLFVAVNIVIGCILPESFFKGHFFYRFLFIFLMMVPEFIGMATLGGEYCVWTQLPGILLGFVSYFALAVYLHFSASDPGHLETLIGLCTLAFVFVGGVCLNRQSIRFTQGDLEHRPPRSVARRNRRIVLIFLAVVSAISFVGPIRSGAVWLFQKFWSVIRWIFSDHSAGSAAPQEALDLGDPIYAAATEIEHTRVQSDLSMDDLLGHGLVYVVLALVAIGVVWILYDLDKKLAGWLESFSRNASEGYYDEKEKLDKGSESRKKLSDLLKDGIKKMLSREPSWDSLSGREKARRLVKELYRKRSRRVNRIRTLTAREALNKMGIKKETVRQMSSAYETARYSEHEVSSEKMDALRKEVKP